MPGTGGGDPAAGPAGEETRRPGRGILSGCETARAAGPTLTSVLRWRGEQVNRSLPPAPHPHALTPGPQPGSQPWAPAPAAPPGSRARCSVRLL